MVVGMRYGADQLRNHKITKLRSSSRGYILLTLMLFVAILAIAALAVLPEMTYQIKRDREEEMMHRAVGYSRAIRGYYKKFGRYPTRIEELESTNNFRFLRKRYKDPVNNDKDFTLLRLGDPALNMLGLGQGLPQGVRPGLPGAPGGGIPPSVPAIVNSPQGTALLQQQNTGTTTATGDQSGNPGNQANSTNPDSSSSSSSSAPGSGSQTFGGGPIVGVVSASKEKTKREFCNKNHYNDWFFIYNPSFDRGGPLDRPYCPSLMQGIGNLGQQGTGQGMVPNAGPGQGVVPNPGQGVNPPPPGPNPNLPAMPPDQ
jgi:type II secretory pathway pseudopilin PulG